MCPLPTDEAKISEVMTEGGPLPADQLPPVPEKVEEPPSLEDDLAHLRKIDCMRVCLMRWKKGKHPDEAIERLLSRRLNFSEQLFMTPFLLRVLTALAVVLSVSVVAWCFFWILFWQLGYIDYLRELSIWMSFFVVALGCLVLANPGRSHDEIALESSIRESIQQLEKEVEAAATSKTGSESDKTEPGKNEGRQAELLR